MKNKVDYELKQQIFNFMKSKVDYEAKVKLKIITMDNRIKINPSGDYI